MTATHKHLLLLFMLTVMFLAACGNAPAEPIILPTLTVPVASLTDSPLPATETPLPSETFTPEPTGTSTPSGIVELMAVGDIMLGRTVGEQVLAQGPQVVFAGVQSELDTADILIGNLECAITERDGAADKAYTLKAPPQTAAALAGFTLLSLSNNHAMDYGYAGLTDTQGYLQQYGIDSVGAGVNAAQAHTPVFLERNGVRLAFLAYTDVPKENHGFDAHSWAATDSQPGIAWADIDQISADVTAAKALADVVIVQLHAGYEVNAYIPPISNTQRAKARAAIDAGATLVVGSHPHILQSIERYNGGLIAYSLGNFVFDDWLGVANDSVILQVTLTRQGVQSFDWVPVTIKNGLPGMAPTEEAQVIGTRVAPLGP